MHIEKEATPAQEKKSGMTIPVTINATLNIDDDGNFTLETDNETWEALIVCMLQSKKAVAAIVKREGELRDKNAKIIEGIRNLPRRVQKKTQIHVTMDTKTWNKHTATSQVLQDYAIHLIKQMIAMKSEALRQQKEKELNDKLDANRASIEDAVAGTEAGPFPDMSNLLKAPLPEHEYNKSSQEDNS